VNCLKNNFKIYNKIDIKAAPTCFGAVGVCALYTQQQGSTNICSHITTHRCILIGYFNICNCQHE